MVTQTRAAAKSDLDASNDSVDVDVPCEGPPPSDASYDRKFVISREGSLPSSRLYQVRHPKNRTPCLYRINEKQCDEIVTVGDSFRSWFYGDSVVSDGAIRLFSPVHPLFLALPYLAISKKVFAELGEVICDSEYPAVAVLLRNEQFLKNIDRICDSKEIFDTKVFRFNEGKAVDWITGRFQRLRSALVDEGSLHKSIVGNCDVLDRYTYGLLCDYMSPEMSGLAKAHLSIKEPSADECESVDTSLKRKTEDLYEIEVQKPAKKPKESVMVKKLQQASKGTRSISNFFNKKA